jgi:hypothetical protein
MIAWLLLVALVAPDPPPAPPGHTRRLRPLSDVARELVSEAARRSPTVAEMLDEIERLDPIVYVELRLDPTAPRGATSLLGRGEGSRFILVVISAALDPRQRLELVGHELRHVLEIARDPGARDPEGVRRLYKAIGWEGPRGTFETDAAIATERQVRSEVGMGRPSARALDRASSAGR